MSYENSLKIGIIFDLDGTLLDSTELLSKIPEELESVYNVSLDESTAREVKNEILNVIQGRSSRFMIVGLIFYVAKKYHVPWYLRLRYLRDAGKLYKKLIKDVPVFPGVKDTLNFLEANGIPYGINTTSSQKEVKDRFEERMDFLHSFRGKVVTRSDIKKLKPHPESIILLSEKLGVPISNLIMVGDMDADILAGINAGCVTVGVLCGYANREMMEEYNPDFIIESVKELPKILPQILEKCKSQ